MSDNEQSLWDVAKHIARKLQRNTEEDPLYPIPGLEIVKPIVSNLSMRYRDIPLSVIGSASMNRDKLGRDPRDIDVMIHTTNKKVFDEIRNFLEKFGEAARWRIDIFPSMGLDDSRPYVTFENGKIVKDNSLPQTLY